MKTTEQGWTQRRTWILGAGMAGLAASVGSSITALEANGQAGP